MISTEQLKISNHFFQASLNVPIKRIGNDIVQLKKIATILLAIKRNDKNIKVPWIYTKQETNVVIAHPVVHFIFSTSLSGMHKSVIFSTKKLAFQDNSGKHKSCAIYTVHQLNQSIVIILTL